MYFVYSTTGNLEEDILCYTGTLPMCKKYVDKDPFNNELYVIDKYGREVY